MYPYNPDPHPPRRNPALRRVSPAAECEPARTPSPAVEPPGSETVSPAAESEPTRTPSPVVEPPWLQVPDHHMPDVYLVFEPMPRCDFLTIVTAMDAEPQTGGQMKPLLQFNECLAGCKCHPVPNTCVFTLTMPENMATLSQQEFSTAMEEAIVSGLGFGREVKDTSGDGLEAFWNAYTEKGIQALSRRHQEKEINNRWEKQLKNNTTTLATPADATKPTGYRALSELPRKGKSNIEKQRSNRLVGLGATVKEEADGRDDKNVVAAQNNLAVYYDQASGQVRLGGRRPPAGHLFLRPPPVEGDERTLRKLKWDLEDRQTVLRQIGVGIDRVHIRLLREEEGCQPYEGLNRRLWEDYPPPLEPITPVKQEFDLVRTRLSLFPKHDPSVVPWSMEAEELPIRCDREYARPEDLQEVVACLQWSVASRDEWNRQGQTEIVRLLQKLDGSTNHPELCQLIELPHDELCRLIMQGSVPPYTGPDFEFDAGANAELGTARAQLSQQKRRGLARVKQQLVAERGAFPPEEGGHFDFAAAIANLEHSVDHLRYRVSEERQVVRRALRHGNGKDRHPILYDILYGLRPEPVPGME
ncbi:Hypp6732 [Branchiostoma lanceolatum]|uniref:Hypp6732 protein n=1 Tax=Branchiostoma lanceolatum TaxID=7740 RepID=A0A8K0E537_BRALA|nr:Hypp6732 [Branchiostoma lanceolatum]